jgi:hypothetical protein
MQTPFSRSKCFLLIRLDLALHIVPRIRYPGFTLEGRRVPWLQRGLVCLQVQTNFDMNIYHQQTHKAFDDTMQHGASRRIPRRMVQLEPLSLLTFRWSKDMVLVSVLWSWWQLEQVDKEILWKVFFNKQGSTSKEVSDHLHARRRGRDKPSLE